MAITFAVLQAGVVLGTASAPLYTVPATHSAWVKRAVFVNTGSSMTTLTVSVARAGGASTVLIAARTIAAGESYVAPELASLVLASGDGIAALAGAAGSLSAVISGLTA